MVILIDHKDKDLFLSVKTIADSGWNHEQEEENLIKLLEAKGRIVEMIYDEDNEENIYISFPKKKVR